MDVLDYIGYVKSEGKQFAAVAEQGDLTAEIPSCPGWDMRELVRHLGLIHLWAAGNVAFPRDDWFDGTDLPSLEQYWPELAGEWPDDADLVSWYRDTHANLVRVLESAPTDVAAFTFLPAPSPLVMWSRRQASEIAIHRFDAEIARGITSHFEPHFAADMLDELLSCFAPRPREIDVDLERVLHVHAHDVNEHWYLTIGPEGIETSRHGDKADLTALGSAADLYLSMWNRTPDFSVALEGDSTLMDLWHETCRVRWSS